MTIARHGQGAPTLYTAEEVAEILRVKKSWLERSGPSESYEASVREGRDTAEPEEYDRGPEMDDHGGKSDYRHAWPDEPQVSWEAGQ